MLFMQPFILNPVKEIIKNRVFMSPMAGVTDIPFRVMVQRYGCKFMFTEMVDANGLSYNSQKTIKMLDRGEDAFTYGAQIVGVDENHVSKAAKMCQDKGFSVLELNAGCPVKKVVKDGKGSALLREPKKLGKLLGRLVKELSIPVTVKMRSGWSDKELNYLEVAKIIESEGASAICVHPRTKMQMYTGIPNHEITRAVKAAVKIPVFASGNVFSPDRVTELMKTTNCDAVAVARGSLGKVWIFNEICAHLSGDVNYKNPGFDDIKKIAAEHFLLSAQFYGEEKTLQRMYKHMQWYFKPYKNRHQIMCRYRESKTFKQFMEFIGRLKLNNKNWLYLEE